MTIVDPDRLSVADLSGIQVPLLVITFALIGAGFFYNSICSVVLMLSTFLYILSMFAKHALFWLGVLHPVDLFIDGCGLDDEALPSYSIIVALYDEAPIIPHLLSALKNMDYPSHKLQIILVVEEGDEATKAALVSTDRNKFQVLIAPKRIPQTKASACNYALAYASGELVVIYDAEDRPAPQQLRQVAFLQQQYYEATCIQCQLGFYNAGQNWITKMFAIEYAALFNYILPNLSRLQTPILLGGSSNHFVKSVLVEVGGWDDYNVTEDADLGLWLHHQKHIVRVANSMTVEEAPTDWVSWLRQRARWLKGHMLSYLVYLKQSKEANSYALRDEFLVHIWLGCSTIATLITPMILPLWFATVYNAADMSKIYACVGLLALHWLLTWAQGCYVCHKQGFGLWWLGYPLYFIAHIIAACIALKQLLLAPYRWDKTPHGRSSL